MHLGVQICSYMFVYVPIKIKFQAQDRPWLTNCVTSTNQTQICKFEITRKKESRNELGDRIEDLHRVHTFSGKPVRSKQVTMCAA